MVAVRGQKESEKTSQSRMTAKPRAEGIAARREVLEQLHQNFSLTKLISIEPASPHPSPLQSSIFRLNCLQGIALELL
jgi:hypothetical protein